MGLIAAKRYLCGPFMGHFPDKNESPPPSDDEEDSDVARYMPKDWNKARHKGRTKKFLKNVTTVARGGVETVGSLRDVGGMGRGPWGSYLTTIEIEAKRDGGGKQQVPAIRAERESINEGMMRKLDQHPTVHTIELTHCDVKVFPPVLDMERLTVLRLPHNNLQTLSHTSASKGGAIYSNLEQLVCNWNKIESIQAYFLSGEFIGKLTILNLAHNQLAFLPADFASGGVQLRFLDLSYNSLQTLPKSILECVRLQLLFINHNALVSLPDEIDRLKALRKVFAGFNHLTSLPENIGRCRKLEKIRLPNNQIRYLPHSMIDLWQVNGGRLEELLILNNPLVQPSITAFEMGGLNQLFKLFNEWIQEETKRELKALEDEVELPALADVPPLPSPLEVRQGQGGEPALLPPTTAVEVALLAEDTELDEFAKEQMLEEAAAVEAEEVADKRKTELKQNYYYFAHTQNDNALIADIRSAESTMLLLKKSLYIEHQRLLAATKMEEAKSLGKDCAPHLHKFMALDFDPSTFTGTIHVTDLDLFFNLLVFTTKAWFTTCATLFRSLNAGNNTETMTRTKWDAFCNRVDLKLSTEIRTQMWNFLTWREPGNLKLTDFIAGWHIHDVEERDPWITRVTRVLRLEFYDMDPSEMRARIIAKGSDEDPALGLGNDYDGDEDDDEKDGKRWVPPVQLPMLEGERRVHAVQQQRRRARPKSQARGQAPQGRASSHEPGRRGSADASGTALAIADAKGLPKVSVKETSKHEAKVAADDSDREVSDDPSLGSHCLSWSTATSESSFVAEDYLQEIELHRSEREHQHDLETCKERFEVRSDADLARLMELPPHEIRPLEKQHSQVQQHSMPSVTRARFKRKRRELQNQKGSKPEPKFQTNVFTVRQAIREASRNLPSADFQKLISFVLRGMKMIEHSTPDDPATYFHVDDPSFRYATGIDSANRYAEQLLLQMGFIRVNDTYWVWPHKHLNFDAKGVWGHMIVPPQCPGLNPSRLHDLIILFRCCQRRLLLSAKQARGRSS